MALDFSIEYSLTLATTSHSQLCRTGQVAELKKDLCRTWEVPREGAEEASGRGCGCRFGDHEPEAHVAAEQCSTRPTRRPPHRPVLSPFLATLGLAMEGRVGSVGPNAPVSHCSYCWSLQDLLTTTDKILDVNITSLWTLARAQEPSMGSDFLKAVETLVHSVSPQQHPFSFSSSNVLLQSQLLRHSSPLGYQMPSAPPLLQARIPWHSLAPLVRNGTNVRITSLALQKLDSRLPSNYTQGLRDTSYATPGMILVISITADGQDFTQAEVIMDFEDMNGTLHCVFWDHDAFQGRGGWSDEGCELQAVNASAFQCICRHLTAFSILMSQHAVPEDPLLDLLSQVGVGASILALLVCLVIYRLVWRVVVRNKVAFFRHTALFNMVICLLVADTCFLGNPWLPSGYHSLVCLATAFLCHFFYLATFFWMLAQALVLAHQLLFVFHQLSKPLVLSLMSILGYLCPLGFAGVTLGLYLPQRKYLREGKCLLSGDGVMLHAFSEPVLAIVSVNGLVLVIAVLKLLRPSLSEGPAVEKRQALVGVLKALLILTPIFGLTWGLGVTTLFEGSLVFHYIFVILNSLQVGAKGGVAIPAGLLHV